MRRRRVERLAGPTDLRMVMAARYRQRVLDVRADGLLAGYWQRKAEQWEGDSPVCCSAWQLPPAYRHGLDPYALVQVDAAGAVCSHPVRNLTQEGP